MPPEQDNLLVKQVWAGHTGIVIVADPTTFVGYDDLRSYRPTLTAVERRRLRRKFARERTKPHATR